MSSTLDADVGVWGAIPMLLLQAVSFTSFYASASATAFTTWLGNL